MMSFRSNSMKEEKKRLGTFLKDLVALLETFYFHPDLTDIKEKECVILQLGRGKSSAVHTHTWKRHTMKISDLHFARNLERNMVLNHASGMQS